mmetsp:Transcript_107825/g.303820  ORF Transcript_107825/g.303820 Transcript_107825/m.303820 type:complete len:329 (+) Transcript_107825:90-1076(+)
MAKRPREGDAVLSPRDYVLLVSGTMNPPHRGHVRLGLHAAHALKQKGHKVSAIVYSPVHDNYLYNKQALKRQTDADQKADDVKPHELCFPMAQRCAMLRVLLEGEDAEEASICHIDDYEHRHSEALLETSLYWPRLLPHGYLRTCPTTTLVNHFARNSPFLAKQGTRLGLVFGIDNLVGIPSWENPGRVFGHADLIFVAREMGSIKFLADPAEMFAALRYVEAEVVVPISFGGRTLFGATRGSLARDEAEGDGALFLLPALEANDEGLSSTSIRKSVTQCLNTLALHGYSGLGIASVVKGAGAASDALKLIYQAALAKQEFVNPGEGS